MNEYLSALAFLLVLEPHISYFLDTLTSRKEVKKNDWWKKCAAFCVSEMKNIWMGGRLTKLALLDPALHFRN